MTYKIIRIDGKDDELTSQSFDNYSEAYDLLETHQKKFLYSLQFSLLNKIFIYKIA